MLIATNESSPFVDSSTTRTSPRSVFGFIIDDCLLAFIFNHLLQSVKSPAMECCSLAFTMPTSTPNAIQLLHHDSISFLQAVHPAYLMQCSIDPAMLPPAKLFKPSLCGEGALLLKGASELSEVLPPMLWFTINRKAIGSYQELVNSYVDTHGIIAFWLRNFDQCGDVQVEFPAIAPVNKLCIPYRVFEQFSLIITSSKFGLNSSFSGANRCPEFSIHEKCKKPFIQIHRKLSEPVLLFPICLVGLGNSIPCSYRNRKISGKLESFTGFVVNKVMQGYRIVNSVIPSHFAYVVASISKSFSIHKLSEFFFKCRKLAHHCLGNFHQPGNFHQYSYMPLRFKNPTEVRRATFLHRSVVSCRQGL